MARTGLLRCGVCMLAMAAGCVPALAQTGRVVPPPALPPAPPQVAAAATADIVVTGTLIRGTPTDAALPVSVVDAAELARQGSPSIVELVKNLPVSSGVLGEPNQYDSRSQGAEGIASINLRGLGQGRTLVLFNGRRLVPAGNGVPTVDVNLLPTAAIGRIEILKDGAAATYGSDAIAGVVNFISNTQLDGFVVSGDYRWIDGSDGDYGGSVAFGGGTDGFRVLASVGYQRRSELRTTERDFALQPFAANPQGGWSGGGNPGNFDFNGPVGGISFVRDLGCEAVGGFRSLPGSNVDRCFTRFTPFNNLIEPEERYQVYVEADIDLGPRTRLNVSTLFGRSETQITTSPSYLPTLAPSGNAAFGGAGLFIIPDYHPALRDYCATFGAAAAGCTVGPTGQPLAPAFAFPVLFRPTLNAGNALYLEGAGLGRRSQNDRGAVISPRISESFRATAAIVQELGDRLNLDAGVTYHLYDRRIEGTDTFVDLFQNALAGFGGANCAFRTPQQRAGLTPAQLAAVAGTQGCEYWNPFSTAIQVNPVTGQVNPNFAGGRPTGGLSAAPGAGLVNSVTTLQDFFVGTQTSTETQLLVGEAVLSGRTGFQFAGGPAGFAVGGQYRREWFDQRYGSNNNLASFPCPGSVLNPAATCVGQPGALGFLGTNLNRSIATDVRAAFVEVQLPFTDAINVQLAARYEDYGSPIGSTFDPQARIRFQLTDWLALRGGAGTTFRGPPPPQTDGFVTSLQIIGTAFRAVDIFGSSEVRPESVTNYSAGVIMGRGPFSLTVDYWRYDLEGPIEAEPVQGIVSALFGATGAANCGNPAFAALQARFTFTAAGCGIGNVGRLSTQFVNNADIRTSGIDAQAQLAFEVGAQGRISVGGSGTYVIDYRIADVIVEGIVVQPAFDAVGLLNFQTTAYPLPQWKGQLFAGFDLGMHSLRAQFNVMDDYRDQRVGLFTPAAVIGSLAGQAVTAGQVIRGFNTVDLTYRVELPTRTAIALVANNVFDRKPPFARLEPSYDPFTANPLGFNAKVVVTQRF